MCETRISLGLMINAGMLLSSSRRLIFGGPVIALGLTGNSSSAVKGELMKPVRRASQFKKFQTAVSTTEHYFTLSVICLIVECSRRQHKSNSNNIQIVVGWLGWNGSKRLSYNYYFLNKSS